LKGQPAGHPEKIGRHESWFPVDFPDTNPNLPKDGMYATLEDEVMDFLDPSRDEV
jgi:hypothetical protein